MAKGDVRLPARDGKTPPTPPKPAPKAGGNG